MSLSAKDSEGSVCCLFLLHNLLHILAVDNNKRVQPIMLYINVAHCAGFVFAHACSVNTFLAQSCYHYVIFHFGIS